MERTWTLKQLCQALGIGRSTAYRWMDENGLPHVKVGGIRLFLVESVLEWLKGHEVVSAPPHAVASAVSRRAMAEGAGSGARRVGPPSGYGTKARLKERNAAR